MREGFKNVCSKKTLSSDQEDKSGQEKVFVKQTFDKIKLSKIFKYLTSISEAIK